MRKDLQKALYAKVSLDNAFVVSVLISKPGSKGQVGKKSTKIKR